MNAYLQSCIKSITKKIVLANLQEINRTQGQFSKKSGGQCFIVNYVRNKRCTIEVFKCLSGIAPTAFEGYFKRNCSKGMNTRGNNKSVVMPKVKSENGKKTFMFQGAKVFNMIPNDMHDSQSLLSFKSRCNDIDFDF